MPIVNPLPNPNTDASADGSLPSIRTDHAQSFYTLCSNCQGQGKRVLAPTKKARWKHKRARMQQEQDSATATTEKAVPPKSQLQSHCMPPPRVQGCTTCQGSGLVKSAADTPVNHSLPTVAIVGGGLAGLALAAACRHRGIPHAVYERDSHFQQRSQGYGLTMQQASKALGAFGIDTLPDGITSTKHAVHKEDGTVVGEWGLRKWGRDTAKKQQPPRRQNVHVARQSLRYELLQAATVARSSTPDESNMYWNHRLLHMETVADNNVRLSFQVGSDITEKRADFVVGADGIRSAVRQALIGDESTPLRYLGCIVILGICQLTDAVRESSDLLDGETVFQTADGTTRIYMMPYSATEYMWQLSFPMAEEEAAALSHQGTQALKEQAIARCESWHVPVPQILRDTPVSLVSGYPVYDRALWTPDMLLQVETGCRRRVTLIGDASHPMSPFKGQGANQALLDALSLARSLYQSFAVNNDTVVEDVLGKFEEEMMTRSAVKVQASAEAAHFLHTDVAIQEGNVTRGAASKTPVPAANGDEMKGNNNGYKNGV